MSDADIPLAYQQDLAQHQRNETMAVHDFAHVVAVMRARGKIWHAQQMSSERVLKGYEAIARRADDLAKDLQALGWPIE